MPGELTTRDAPHTVATLERERGQGLLRWLVGALVNYRVVRGVSVEASGAEGYRTATYRAEGSLARPDVLESARKLGLRFVGVYAFQGLLGWIPREGWVSEDGALRVSARRGVATGLEAQMSPYYLSTTFDDGSCVLTWGASPAPIGGSDRVESFGGTGDLAVDVATHRAAVELHAAAGRAPIPAQSIEDCVALSAYFDRCLSTDSLATSMVTMRVVKWSVLALAIGLLARFLWSLLAR